MPFQARVNSNVVMIHGPKEVDLGEVPILQPQSHSLLISNLTDENHNLALECPSFEGCELWLEANEGRL